MNHDDEKRVEEAVAYVQTFISRAQLRALDDYQRTLYEIARLPTLMAWRAPQMAEEALGVGPYWCKGFGRGQDKSPKSLWSYYFRKPFRALSHWFRRFR